MDVREFVRDVLLQVLGGVSDAQQAYPSRANEVAMRKGAVNPAISTGIPSFQRIEFEIGVEVEQSTAKAGLRVSVGSIGFSREPGDASTATSTNRIKFGVPVAFPTGPS